MFRILVGATARFSRLNTRILANNVANKGIVQPVSCRNYSQLLTHNVQTQSLLANPKITTIASNIVTRNLIKYSFRKGKRKTVRAVLRRFYRLNWGGWIRTKCGRHKKLWKKSYRRKWRLRQHVLCNATQSKLLDKMVNKYWKTPKFYVDDPYNPYHVRNEFVYTSKVPRPYFPPE